MPSAAPPDTPALPLVRVSLAGLIAGFTSGLFGVGGGIVIVPVLAMVAGFPHKLATGTSLTAIVPIAVAGSVGYATAGEVDWAAAAFVAVGALAGAAAGTRLLAQVSVPGLQLAFAVAMAVTALRMLVEDGDGGGRSALTVWSALALVLLGLAAGVLAGLLGIGGGILIVPALTVLFGVPLALAKGTSLLVIIPTAVMGTLRNRRTGLTALKPAAVVGVAGIASALAASRISLGLDPQVSSALFAVLLILMAVRLGRTSLSARRLAAAGSG